MFDFFQHAGEHWLQVDYTQISLVVWALILLALTFDYLNGMHDAANSIATIVSTRVLSPKWAVLWAAFFNFVAFVIFPLKVAGTIQKDIVDQSLVTDPATGNALIAGTLIAACLWNLITWWAGLPTSSSHALIGGLIGSALVLKGGDLNALQFGSVGWPFTDHAWNLSGLSLVCLFIVLAPMIGFTLGSIICIAVFWICRHMTPQKVDRFFRIGQFFSASFFSIGHGGNDAQKTMAIIFILLIAASKGVDPSTGSQAFATPTKVPTEVVLACHLAMGLGTLSGGWRIVKTMGQKIIRLRPVDGFCAETGAALTLALTTFFKGIPVSTTHTITGAIVGVGSLKRFSAVRWGVAGRVVWAWILTIPASAIIAALTVELGKLCGWM
jgi:PiT family inorganic phosphate transporter